MLNINAKQHLLTTENKKYLARYMRDVFSINTEEEPIHLYLLQSIRCKNCATHSFEYITQNDTTNVRKYVVIPNQNIDTLVLQQLKQLPNVHFLTDTHFDYLKYGLLFSFDLAAVMKNQEIADYAFIYDKNKKNLKRLLK